MPGRGKAAPVQPRNPGFQELFVKTKACKFFELGTCTRGSACVFAHGAAELAPPPDFSRTKLCRELVTTGVCNRPDCTFAHNRKELRRRGGQGGAAVDRPEPPRPVWAAVAAPDAGAALQAAYAREMGRAAAPACSSSFPSRAGRPAGLAQPPELPRAPPALRAAWGQPGDWCGSTGAPQGGRDPGPPPGCHAGVPMPVQVQEAAMPPPRPRPAGQPAAGPPGGRAAHAPAQQAQARPARQPPPEATPAWLPTYRFDGALGAPAAGVAPQPARQPPPGDFGDVPLHGSAGCFGGGAPGGSSGSCALGGGGGGCALGGSPSGGCGALGSVARLAPVHEAREMHAPQRPARPADLPERSPLKVSVKNSFLHVGADEEDPCMRMTQTVDCLPLVDLGQMPLSQHIDSQAYSATLETLPDDDGDEFGRIGSLSDCLRDPLSVSSITVRNTFIDLPPEGLLAQARQVHTIDYLPSVG